MVSDYIEIYNGRNVKNNGKRGVFVGMVVLLVVVIICIIAFIVSAKHDIVEVFGYYELGVNVPERIKDDFSSNLTALLSKYYSDDDANKDDVKAVIRPGSYGEILMNDLVTNISFIIDIDAYKQTYYIALSWSDTVQVPQEVFIECAKSELRKYKDVVCYDDYGSEQNEKNLARNPIYNELPIIVNEFDVYSRFNVHYEIRGYFDADNNIVISVVDYSGGNLENAKQKIIELGYNPDDFKINYVDYSKN